MADPGPPEDTVRPAEEEAAAATLPLLDSTCAPDLEKPPVQVAPDGEAADAETFGQPGAKAGGPVPPPLPVQEPVGVLGVRLREVLDAMPGWLLSTVFHVAALLILAVLTLPQSVIEVRQKLLVAVGKPDALEDIEAPDDMPLEEIDVRTAMAFELPFEPEEIDVAAADAVRAAPMRIELSDVGLECAPKSDLLASIGSSFGDALAGRGQGKARLVLMEGGSEGSEAAVGMALSWLAAHQLHDGSWNFNHTLAARCGGKCRHPGLLADARNAATGLALLPFLGAGQTHKEGAYHKTIRKGIYFLRDQMQLSPQGGSLWEPPGRMYSHGICAIALCEAYAMTRDKALRAPAQQAIDFICYAQHPAGGGWRYDPKQPGDTSVMGWQILALKSGHLGYLRVPPLVIDGATRFLDTVQANGGAHYGYTQSMPDRPATTAIGLLCRMYLGWKHDNPVLERGVRWLAETGPSETDLYYNYYATQVMRHWEGELWHQWNRVMRDQLVDSQSTVGHERGSWHMLDEHGRAGGRLYTTAMATMILEIYYRHLPIYRKQSMLEGFPLD